MKKVLIMLLTGFSAILGGVLGNAAVCFVTVYLWGINAVFGVFCGIFAVFALTALLTAVGKRVRKLGVNRTAFLICAQTPSLAILSMALVSTYRQMNDSSGNGMFDGLGRSLARAIFPMYVVMLVAVAAVTVCVVIAAFSQKTKQDQQRKENIK